MTKYFLHCEFIESDSIKIELVSIGIACSDGREYYAINMDFDPDNASTWMRDNILNRLPPRTIHVYDAAIASLPRQEHDRWLLYSTIGSEVLAFCDPVKYGKPEFWSNYGEYNWICFCQLFGTLMKLPEGLPIHCLDLQQWSYHLGKPQLPRKFSRFYSAIEDARHNKVMWEFLNEYQQKRQSIETPPHFHPSNSPIFALTNLPEVVKGALFSRYSRSPDSIKDILAKEFLDEGEGKAEAFYDRVLGAYGDDSVAELGGAHIACENISDLLAQEIANSRIGISILQKSTRYVKYGADGATPYFIPSDIDNHPMARSIYIKATDLLFDTYHALLPRTIAALKFKHPQGDTPIGAYDRSLNAKALDLLRGLLPVGTKTNLGLYGNGRAYEYLLVKLNASELPEAQAIASQMKIALDGVIAPFVKRADEPRGRAYSEYLKRSRSGTKANTPRYLKHRDSNAFIFGEHLGWANSVHLSAWDTNAFESIIEAIFYADSNASISDIVEWVGGMDDDEKQQILDSYCSNRSSRHQRPGRALELAEYTFEITADIGIYRDLHRHRLCTEIPQGLGVDLGYETPDELNSLGQDLTVDYQDAIESVKQAYRRLYELGFTATAKYLIPMAYRRRWLLKINLREIIHLCELRSQPSGHIGYRKIAWEIADTIINRQPMLASQFKFVDRSVSELGRLNAEVKLEEKS